MGVGGRVGLTSYVTLLLSIMTLAFGNSDSTDLADALEFPAQSGHKAVAAKLQCGMPLPFRQDQVDLS